MTSKTRIRVAVIGAGAWARVCHLPVLRSRPEVELVAVSDVDLGRAQAAAAEFDIPLVATKWRDVFAEPLDACVVATPAAAHYEQASAALAAGAHVLIEKPMVLRHAEAVDLIQRAAAANRQVIVSFGWNYSEMYRAACALFAEPGVGQVEHMLVHMASATRDLLTGASLSSSGMEEGMVAAPGTWTDPRISGGGYGQAQLPHALGVALGIVGESIVSASAVAGGPLATVETCLAVSGRLSGGGSLAISGASFHAGLSGNRHQLEVRVFGSEGNLLVDFERDELRLERPDGTHQVALPPGAGRYDGRGPAGALVDVALGWQTSTPSNGELGCRTVEALEQIYDALGVRRAHESETNPGSWKRTIRSLDLET